jgi:hypothetical protein
MPVCSLVNTGDPAGARPKRRVSSSGCRRYDWLLLAESHLPRRLFRAMLPRIWALPVPTG